MRTARNVCAAIVAAGLFTAAGPRAEAQPARAPSGLSLGEWWIEPSIQLRTRGEYHRPGVPIDPPSAVIGSGFGYGAPIRNQWFLHERARLGLAVERGPIAGVVAVQDSRLWGSVGPMFVDANADQPVSFYRAYLEVRGDDPRPASLRVGRQEVKWGEGRLLGISDWSPRPRTLDAIRARYSTRACDFEALAAVLSPPGAVPAAYSATGSSAEGTGAQLYGMDARVHLDPLFRVEIAGLARIARWPLSAGLVPSDTYVASARLFGDRLGLDYAVEAAYEIGRTAAVGAVRDLAASAVNARLSWQTAWLLRPRFGISGAYASGSEDSVGATVHRFDPILPDNRSGLGQMGLYAWTNIADVAVTASAAPIEDLDVSAAYRQLRLSDASGAWFSADLVAIGRDRSNVDHFLGHEVDAAVTFTPYGALAIGAGYGALFAGAGARKILRASGRGDSKLLHAAFVQATLTAP
jgi:hypothetical protein